MLPFTPAGHRRDESRIRATAARQVQLEGAVAAASAADDDNEDGSSIGNSLNTSALTCRRQCGRADFERERQDVVSRNGITRAAGHVGLV